MTHNLLTRSLIPLSLVALAGVPALAQDLEDPNIKVEFGNPANGVRQSFDAEDGLRTKGVLRLGPDAVRVHIGNQGQAKLIKRNGKLHGGEINVGLSTRISVPSDVTEEELRAAVAELHRKEVFSGELNATATLTRENVGGSVDGRLGQSASSDKTKVVTSRIYLGPVYLNVIAVGQTTSGGASAEGGMAVDLDWKQGTLSFGGMAGLNLPKKLSGRGVRGGVILQLEINRLFLQELKAAIEAVRARLRSVAASLRSAGRTVRNHFTGYRGPTVDVEKREKIAVTGAPADLSGLSNAAIAQRYAPVVFQPTKNQHDLIRKVDFDGDWNTKNNWDNSGNGSFDKKGYAYYDVKQTETHYLINYAFYYARRSGNKLTRHENDMAGVTIVARKNAPLGQEVEMVFATDGSGLSLYTDDKVRRQSFGNGSRRGGANNDREHVTKFKGVNFNDEAGHPFADTNATHAQIWITPKTHSVYAFNGRDDVNAFQGKRGVIYQPGAAHVAPTAGNNTVGYGLIPMTELKNASSKDGRLRGNEGADNSARLPWAFDSNLPGLIDGALLKNPAKAIARILKVDEASFSTSYVKTNDNAGAAGNLAGYDR